MKILLAGPGTGKTTKIKEIIKSHGDGTKFLILSFTNATVEDLKKDLESLNVSSSNCMTLHKFAVKYNHDKSRQVLISDEVDILCKIAKQCEIDFSTFCDFLDCTTFDQMVSRFVQYAKSNPLYLKEKLSDFEYLIVDEFQDFNPPEQELIEVLIEGLNEAYVLGDDDQCIYDFKDASSDKIISLHQLALQGEHEIVPHEHICYRCPDQVVQHASRLIGKNQHRVKKEWKKSGKSGLLTYRQFRTLSEVANDIVKEIECNLEGKILILTPVGFAVHPLVEKLTEVDLPFDNTFQQTFLPEYIDQVWQLRSLFGSYQYLNLVLIGYKRLKSRRKFYELLKIHFSKGKNFEELFQFLQSVLPERMSSNHETPIDFLSGDSYENLSEKFLSSSGTDDQMLSSLLRREVSLLEPRIRIMSIHKSKGLGADHVFMLALNEGVLPNRKKGNDSLEAQRRLFYVGLTRAKENLFLYSNIEHDGRDVNRVNKSDFKYNQRSKKWNAKASSFIDELGLNI